MKGSQKETWSNGYTHLFKNNKVQKKKKSDFRKKGDHFDNYKYLIKYGHVQFYFPVLSSDIHLTKYGCLKCVSELINMSFFYSQQNETGIFLSSVSH